MEAITDLANPPEIQDLDELTAYYPDLANLTPIRRSILFALLENTVSEDRKTETEIALDLGINRRTILDARKNPVFIELLGRLSIEMVRANVDKPIQNLFSLGKTNVKANEILARIAEVYRPTQRILSQSMNINARTQYTDTDDMISAFLAELKAQGYTKERISALYDAL